MNDELEVNRGFSLDGKTQMGFAGSTAQVQQQRMSDLEGRGAALRWESMKQWHRSTALLKSLSCMSDEQSSLLTLQCESAPAHQANTDTLRPNRGQELPDKYSP